MFCSHGLIHIIAFSHTITQTTGGCVEEDWRQMPHVSSFNYSQTDQTKNKDYNSAEKIQTSYTCVPLTCDRLFISDTGQKELSRMYNRYN